MSEETRYLQVDHRYALDQFRVTLLSAVVYGSTDLGKLAERSGFALKYLQSLCWGKATISYQDMESLLQTMYAPVPYKLQVVVNLEDLTAKYPLEVGFDAAKVESERLLEQAVEAGKLKLPV
jgi:hypothetical protein